MTETPRVSVILPAYNAERTLAEAIESLLTQSFTDFELIIVDDGSTDETSAVIGRCAATDARIVCLVNPTNQGISRSRNRALAAAKGEFVACLDSDDVADSNRLVCQVEFMEAHPECVLVGSDLAIIDEQSVVVGHRSYPHADAALRRAMPRRNPFAQPACLFRTQVARDLGGYREDLPVCEDYDLFFRLAEKGGVANIPLLLTCYRISGMQTKTTRLHETIYYTLLVQRQAFARGWIPSVGDSFYRFFLHLLLWLPAPLVLRVFSRLTYRSN